MNIEEYIKFECDRQHTTKTAEMSQAFEFAASVLNIPGPTSLGKFVESIANLVEPEINVWRLSGSRYVTFRSSHVGFMNGGSAAPTAEVPERFFRLMKTWDSSLNSAEIDLWIKSLLDIHPWQDGNGRTASILRNWMLGRIGDPEILPFFYQNC